MDQTIMTSFLNRKKQYDAESDLMKELENKPMSEGQVMDMLTRGFTDYEAATNKRYFEDLILEFKKQGLIVKDSSITFSQFKKDNPGVIVFRQSTFYQMELGEYERFRNALAPENKAMLIKRAEPIVWKLYEDMPLDLFGQGYPDNVAHYKHGNKITGYGWKVATNLLPSPLDRDDQQKINNAERIYAQARNEIAEVFNKLEIPITPEAERQP